MSGVSAWEKLKSLKDDFERRTKNQAEPNADVCLMILREAVTAAELLEMLRQDDPSLVDLHSRLALDALVRIANSVFLLNARTSALSTSDKP